MYGALGATFVWVHQRLESDSTIRAPVCADVVVSLLLWLKITRNNVQLVRPPLGWYVAISSPAFEPTNAFYAATSLRTSVRRVSAARGAARTFTARAAPAGVTANKFTQALAALGVGVTGSAMYYACMLACTNCHSRSG